MTGKILQSATSSDCLYKPLEPGTIRLLHLQPADSLAVPLVGTLELVQLDEKATYEALSYAWDGAFDNQSLPDGRISLHGSPFSIKGNLRDALQRLRYTTRARALWVDAICINQEDIVERSAQVAIMAQIYTTADQVIMWVGEDSVQGDGKLFVEWCRKRTSVTRPSWSRIWRAPPLYALKQICSVPVNEDWIPSWLTNQYNMYPMFSWKPQQRHELMMQFMRRRYFFRRWCVQEITFAKRVLLVCGGHELPWTIVHKLNYCTTGSIPFDRLLTFRHNHRRGILQLLQECQSLHCRDERDRIYALASILKLQPECSFFTIDYTLHWTKMYVQFACGLIMANGLTELWPLLRMAGSQSIQDRCAKLPSWVPDWRLAPLSDVLSGTQSDELTIVAPQGAVTCNYSTLSLPLAFYGILGAIEGKSLPKDEYRPDDSLYGLDPEHQIYRYPREQMFHTKHLLVLRPCEGKNLSFRIVGIFEPWRYGSQAPFVAIHDIAIR